MTNLGRKPSLRSARVGLCLDSMARGSPNGYCSRASRRSGKPTAWDIAVAAASARGHRCWAAGRGKSR
jgi:hypothetical protein